MVYYCPNTGDFFIFQNFKTGIKLKNFSEVCRGFTSSWNVMEGTKYQLQDSFPNLQFTTDKIIEVW